MNGLFITFEGIDGCGKSTQSRLAEARLREEGRSVLLTREPGGTPVAEKIRSLILDPRNDALSNEAEVLLYLASRAQHVGEKIRPALEQGDIVLCDRFSEATYAYQGWGRGFDIEVLRSVNRFATGGLIPDHTFVFDLPVGRAVERMAAAGKAPDRLESNPRDFHERIREGYLLLARAEPGRISVFNAALDAETIADAVYIGIMQLITKRVRE